MLKIIQLALSALIATVMTPVSQPKAATYAFNPSGVVTSDPSASNGSPTAFPAVSISIQESAVQSGSFSAAYVGGPANFYGDYASLISFTIGNAVTVTPASGAASTFRANLLFNVDGSVSTGALFYSGDSFAIDLAGSATLFQGVFAPTDTGGQGFVTGTLTAVPEPTSIVLLTVGIFGLALIRQRARSMPERRCQSPARSGRVTGKSWQHSGIRSQID